MVKLGLIGAGYWGKNLVREFNNIGILDTICEINCELIDKYRRLYPNLNYTSSWLDLLNNEKITAVCVSLPAEMHYEFVKQALLADKDVYVEKPITLNILEGEELIKLSKQKGKILMVGHLLHYHPAIEKMKSMISNGEIGEIRNIIANRLNLGIFRTQENVLWSFAPHDISLILSLCGDSLPTWVKCNGQSNLTEGIHDITNSILKFEDNGQNIYVNINVSWLNPYKEQKISIIGTKGMIIFDDVEKENKLQIYKNYIKWTYPIAIESEKNPPCLQPVANKSTGQVIDIDLSESALMRECQHFYHCCLNRLCPLTSGEEGLNVLKVLEALSQSLKNDGNSQSLTSLVSPLYWNHSTAIVDDGAEIGDLTKIWHYSHICSNAKIGKNCNIGQNVFIAGGAKLGNHCKVQNNVSIYAGVEAEDYVFFGPSCVLTNDKNPRGMYSKNGYYLQTYLETGVTLGANSTIVCGTRIGKHALIGAGAVVTKDVEPYSIMVGNPAKKIGTIDESGNRQLFKNKK